VRLTDEIVETRKRGISFFSFSSRKSSSVRYRAGISVREGGREGMKRRKYDPERLLKAGKEGLREIVTMIQMIMMMF